MSRKTRALLFGLNYKHTAHAQLNGCINDCVQMAAYLQAHLGFARVDTYTDDTDRASTSAQGIVQKLYELAVDSYREELDLVWIHYSGHGSYVQDDNGDDKDGHDECLVPSDFETAGMVRDDVIQSVLRHFNPKTRVVCVFDCCHSGTIGDVKYSWESPTRVQVENILCSVPAKVITISGCLDSQTSADAYNLAGNNTWAGALTTHLLLALKDAPLLAKDVFKLVSALRNRLKTAGFSQVPKLCSTYNLAREKALVP